MLALTAMAVLVLDAPRLLVPAARTRRVRDDDVEHTHGWAA
jgi:hypothetical protein